MRVIDGFNCKYALLPGVREVLRELVAMGLGSCDYRVREDGAAAALPRDGFTLRGTYFYQGVTVDWYEATNGS